MSKENLSQRGYLNTVTTIVEQFSKIVIKFILDPLIVRYVGVGMFGVWQVLLQMISYFAAADLRTGTALKWIVAKDRSTKSDHELSTHFSSALFANIFILPVFIIFGFVLFYVSPKLVGNEPVNITIVQNAVLLLIIGFILGQFLFLYESVLTGMNLAFKRLGVRPIINVISAILIYFLIKMDFNIFGLAIGNLFLILVSGLTFAIITIKNVSWVKIIFVPVQKIISFTKLSLWYLLDKASNLLNDSIDLVLIGYLINSTAVAYYVATRIIIMSFVGLVNSIQGSIIPGISKYYGEGRFGEIINYRNRSNLLTFLLVGTICIAVQLLNRSFVFLWMGSDFYLGATDTFLLLSYFIVKSFMFVERSIVLISTDIKVNIGINVVAAIVTCSTVLLFNNSWGITGILIGMLTGMLVRYVLYSRKVSALIDTDVYIPQFSWFYRFITLFVLIILMGYISSIYLATNWMELILAFVVVGISGLCIIGLVLGKTNRIVVVTLLKKINFLKFND